MRTLKKVLALSLALAMALSFMSFAAYTDADKFDKNCTDSIELLGKLGVMKGDTTGFRPTDTLTRGEAAKIVYTVLMGSDDGAASYKSMQVFKDVPAALWSAGYINYLSDLAIVGGVGNGNFNPEGKVTGSELAKMLLGLLGYDAEILEFSGAKWETNVKKAAGQAGLNSNYNLLMSAPAQRQWVAKMVNNALSAKMGTTTKLAGFVAADGGKYLKVEKFGLKVAEEVVITAVDTANNKFTAGAVTYPEGNTTGVKYFGHSVTITYREKNSTTAKEIYSIVDNAKLVETIDVTAATDVNEAAFKKLGFSKAPTADTKYAPDYVTATGDQSGTITGLTTGSLTVISNSTPRTVDFVINNAPFLDIVYNVLDKDGKVQRINSLLGTTYIVSYDADGEFTGKVNGFADLTTEKEGQPVSVTKIGDTYTIEMLKVVSGTVTSKVDGSKIKFSDGNTYKKGSPTLATAKGGYSAFDYGSFNFKDTVNLYLNSNGKVVAVKGATAAKTTFDYAYLAATRRAGGGGYGDAVKTFAYVVFADGTQGEYEVGKYFTTKEQISTPDTNPVTANSVLYEKHNDTAEAGAVYGVKLQSNGKVNVYEDAAYNELINTKVVAGGEPTQIKNGVAKLASNLYATSTTTYFIVAGNGTVKPGSDDFSVKGVTGYNAVTTLTAGTMTSKVVETANTQALCVLVTGAKTGTTVLAEDVYYYNNDNTVTETADGKTISYDLYKNGVKEVYTVNSKTVYSNENGNAGFVRKTDTGLVAVDGVTGYLKTATATGKYENLLVLTGGSEIMVPDATVIIDLTSKSTFDGTLEPHNVFVNGVAKGVTTTFAIEYKPAASDAGFTGTAVTIYVLKRVVEE